MAPRNSSHSENSSSRNKRVSHLDKDSEEYRKHRERNNLAVKRSRTKSKMRAQETQAKVAQLRAENESLNAKIKILNKELSFLKDLFLAHAGATGNRSLEGVDFSFLNEDPGCMSEAKSSIVKDEEMLYAVAACLTTLPTPLQVTRGRARSPFCYVASHLTVPPEEIFENQREQMMDTRKIRRKKLAHNHLQHSTYI